MIAAVYARKSTEQFRADDEAKSVQIQIANARAFANARGWTVDDSHVYADDAVSGAETRKLVNRQRLLDVLAADRPPFQVLIMRDASRFSRRDGDEAFGELKRIAQLGIDIWFYQDAQRFTFGTFGDNVVGFVRAEMNAEYRRQIAKLTKEAFLRKAKAGHVTGGRAFGYDNVCSKCDRVIPIGAVRCCRDGHTDKRINDAHAVVIRQIFTWNAEGLGFTRIAKRLNAEGAPTPVPVRGGPAGWSPTTVREVVHRPLYRGEVIYNRTQRRGADGAAAYAPRPESDWCRVDRPDLRIVSDDAWRAAHARIGEVRLRLATVTRGTFGRGPRRRDGDSPYLLSGFTRCAECGGSVGVLDRRQYGCIAYHKRGTTVCRNAVKVPIATLEDAVLRKITGEALRPAAVKELLDIVFDGLAPRAREKEQKRRQYELATLDLEIARLTEAVATGGPLTPLLDGIKARTERRSWLAAEVADDARVDPSRLNRSDIERRARERLTHWREELAGGVAETRQALREILNGPIVLTPKDRTYRFDGQLGTARIFGEIGLPTIVARPAAQSKGCIIPFSGIAA